MNEDQRIAMADFMAGWLEKASVALLIVGMFQKENAFIGLIGAMITCLAGIILKIWIKR